MLRTRHVSVDLTARVRERDRLDRSTLSDVALAARGRGGDLEARGVLVERHAGLVHAGEPDLEPIGVDGALRDCSTCRRRSSAARSC